jgi:hydroxymethylpyrimidine pyrophosphatase-like HAD family hydrolase
METLKEWGMYYISNRRVHENDAVMFDIDDTLIFTDGRPNTPMIDLLHEAVNMGYQIIIITARPGLESVIKWTVKQLDEYKIGYHYLGFTSTETKHIMKQKLPYKFILSVGDMPTDLTESKHYLNISSYDHN